MNGDTAIIIPVYNEAKVINDVLKKVLKVFPNVMCIDDGSSDDSALEIRKTKAILIKHPINMGQGAALQTGIEYTREMYTIKYFVTFDADGQHRTTDAQAMVKELRKGKYDIILGSRFLGKSQNMKQSKLIVLKLAIKFSNLVSGIKLTDTHNGLRAFNREVADKLQITMPDMAHASEILDIIAKQKYRYKEIPVTIEYSDYSLSKGQGLVNAVNIGFDIVLKKLTK